MGIGDAALMQSHKDYGKYMGNTSQSGGVGIERLAMSARWGEFRRWHDCVESSQILQVSWGSMSCRCPPVICKLNDGVSSKCTNSRVWRASRKSVWVVSYFVLKLDYIWCDFMLLPQAPQQNLVIIYSVVIGMRNLPHGLSKYRKQEKKKLTEVLQKERGLGRFN